MIVYYSGHAGGQRDQEKDWEPEVVLGEAANVMVTYIDFHKRSKPNGRLKAMLLCRKRGTSARQSEPGDLPETPRKRRAGTQ